MKNDVEQRVHINILQVGLSLVEEEITKGRNIIVVTIIIIIMSCVKRRRDINNTGRSKSSF